MRCDSSPGRSTMRTYILALVMLGVGAAAGTWNSYRDLAGEELPTKAFLAYFQQQRDPLARRDGPRLVVPSGETYDFGSLPLWAKKTHDFVVRNEGTEDLRLVMGKPTCSCTAAGELKEGDTLEIAPGKERTITLEWEIKSSLEHFNQSAPFTTNDPMRRKLVLAIMGRVEEAIQRSRQTVVFSNVPASATVTESLRLDTKQTEKLSIVSHRWLKPEAGRYFDVEIVLIPKEESNKLSPGVTSAVVNITLKPGLPLGRFEESLELTTNMDIPPLQVAVQGTVIGDLSFFGPDVKPQSRSLPLGVIKQGAGKSRTIYVMVKGPHRNDTQFTVKKVEPANLRAMLGEAITQNPNVRMIPLTIEIPADAPPINLSGSENGQSGHIILETTHPTIKELELQVFYIIRE